MPRTMGEQRHTDGYAEAEQLRKDNVCSECHGELSVPWDGGRGQYVVRCSRGHEPLRLLPRSQMYREEMRARMDRNPGVQQALAIQGIDTKMAVKIPLTTDAIKSLSNAELEARLEANAAAFGDVRNPSVRSQIMGLCRLYGLDPLFDLRMYQGSPFITYDGRMRKLREHPDFEKEVELRPLDKDEKESWGWDARDIVIKCIVKMRGRGDIFDFGVVKFSGETSPVAKANGPLMAIKRARARVSRVAVGIELPTIIDGRHQVIEVSSPDELPEPARVKTAEDRERARFWATARNPTPDGLGLTDDEVHELLGVESVNGYPGGWGDATQGPHRGRGNR